MSDQEDNNQNNEEYVENYEENENIEGMNQAKFFEFEITSKSYLTSSIFFTLFCKSLKLPRVSMAYSPSRIGSLDLHEITELEQSYLNPVQS